MQRLDRDSGQRSELRLPLVTVALLHFTDQLSQTRGGIGSLRFILANSILSVGMLDTPAMACEGHCAKACDLPRG